ncbi:hypothetical protein [Azotosporobacter soli]|uniref:hypothetical protein n=1 Tax=Azotosporobacter soli TaxID=3055040 RepID=UPI0031FEFA4A
MWLRVVYTFFATFAAIKDPLSETALFVLSFGSFVYYVGLSQNYQRGRMYWFSRVGLLVSFIFFGMVIPCIIGFYHFQMKDEFTISIICRKNDFFSFSQVWFALFPIFAFAETMILPSVINKEEHSKEKEFQTAV